MVQIQIAVANKNMILLASSLGQLLTGWCFAQYGQQVIATYIIGLLNVGLFQL